MAQPSNMFLYRRFALVLFILGIFISAAICEKEPVDESGAPRTEPAFPSVRGHVVEQSDKEETKVVTPQGGNLGFIHAFVAAISVIVVSELGDKTFFIAAIMAMRHPRLTVFLGAASALAFMTVLSAVFGWAATIIPRAYTYYISTALFAIFGLKMLRDGYYMSPNEGQEELEEVQSDLRKREDEYERETTSTGVDVETGGNSSNKKKGRWRASALKMFSRIFVQAFTLTFLAEWGDRSQLTTIILAANEDVVGVTVGGTLGHCLCTGLAVLGGRMIAQRISVRTVTIIGGVVFLIFAVSALFFDPNAV
ncbi:transmembrane protein 165 isoform X2 [Thrips palmi]|uniref:GDT1 family protein n=1 Tax=Thrips palmi TaxID=161013 RepID=A0A6P8ZWK1_THRPL|nr:transmembrane protein 165 isoform X2 [Thrips palmi]